MMQGMVSSVARRHRRRRWGAAAMLCALLGAVQQPAPAQPEPDPEQLLIHALIESKQGRIDGALQTLHPLLGRAPPFRAAELLYRDLVGELLGDETGAGIDGRLEAERAALLAESEARWAGFLDLHTASWHLPSGLLRASDKQHFVVVVDLSRSRLYLFERVDSGFELRTHFYVSAGRNGPFKQRQGDRRTPVGVYFVTSRVAGSVLPDFYGAGALPVNYPNEWDLRQRRSGHGIWLHGVPSDTYSRAPRASDGCLALSNDLFGELWQRLEPVVTPVLIYEQIDWVPHAEAAARSEALLGAIESWRLDWQSLDQQRYASHYAAEFRSGRRSRERWLQDKAQAHAGKRFLRVELHELSAFGYPGEEDLVVVSFRQVYRSNNYDWEGYKRQYWRLVDGRWQIVLEGEARFLPVHERGLPSSARVTAALF